MSFTVGETVRLPLNTFSDNDQTVAADPTAISFDVTDPDGNTTTDIWPGGDIVRTALGVFYLDVPADTAGFWTGHAEATGAVTTAQNYAWEVRAAFSTHPWRPDLTTVATYIAQRTVTVTAPGVETPVGTFTHDTTPTADQAATLVDAAVRHVATRVGATIAPALYEQARDAAAMRAAGLIELSYPIRDADLNTGDRWLKLADGALDTLIAANPDPTGSPGALVPVYSFPDAPLYADIPL